MSLLFKVGDKVTISNPHPNYKDWKGLTLFIVSCEENCKNYTRDLIESAYYLDGCKNIRWFESELSPIEAAEPFEGEIEFRI